MTDRPAPSAAAAAAAAPRQGARGLRGRTPTRLLLVASDRVSAFDVVMGEPVPCKGAVLTQISAFWFRRLEDVGAARTSSPRDADEIVGAAACAAPAIATSSRAARCWCAAPSRCRSSAWCAAISPARRGQSTGSTGTLAGEPLPAGLIESARLEPPLFSPATKAETGHDVNVTFDAIADRRWARDAGRPAARRELRRVPRRPRPRRGPGDHHRRHQVRVRPRRRRRRSCLIDEVMTPDSSRFWPADRYQPGRHPAQLRQAAAARLSRGAADGRAGGTARRRRRRSRPRWSRRPAGATSRRSGCITGRELERPPDADGARGPLVHRRRLAIAVVLIVLAASGSPAGGCGAVLWIALAIWVVAFFRDPAAAWARGRRYVIAPADGKVVSMIEIDEPAFLGGRALRISIFMNVFDCPREPVSDRAAPSAYRHYNAGKFGHAGRGEVEPRQRAVIGRRWTRARARC